MIDFNHDALQFHLVIAAAIVAAFMLLPGSVWRQAGVMSEPVTEGSVAGLAATSRQLALVGREVDFSGQCALEIALCKKGDRAFLATPAAKPDVHPRGAP
jgi:hypothetical protein